MSVPYSASEVIACVQVSACCRSETIQKKRVDDQQQCLTKPGALRCCTCFTCSAKASLEENLQKGMQIAWVFDIPKFGVTSQKKDIAI